MSCRCCGTDSAKNSAVLSAESVSANSNNGCYWPSFANLPRNTTPTCGCANQNNVSNSYNNSCSRCRR